MQNQFLSNMCCGCSLFAVLGMRLISPLSAVLSRGEGEFPRVVSSSLACIRCTEYVFDCKSVGAMQGPHGGLVCTSVSLCLCGETAAQIVLILNQLV